MTRARSAAAARSLLPLLALLILVAAVYAQTREFTFVNYDDDQMITRNHRVTSGLTGGSFLWALTTAHEANWMPLTWLSHQAAVSLFGLDPGRHHLVNLLLHLVGTALLFILFRHLTGALWPSIAVAAVFGLHPLHVESVAWISERKDVLSGIFWMLTMVAYTAYAKRPGPSGMAAVAACMSLGLMAKPMLVTLPLILLLLDWWPLGRLAGGRPPAGGETGAPPPRSPRALVLEKAPLFALSAAASLITWHFQSTGGAVRGLETYPLRQRSANVLISLVSYIVKAIWPSPLAVYYPYRESRLLSWQALGAAGLLLAASLLAAGLRKKLPWLFTGWFWFLMTLLPVIGIVQVGDQAMADRYTYIPLTGLSLIAVWGAAETARRFPRIRRATVIAVCLALALLARTAWVQAGYWRNSETLFRHAVEAVPGNWLAHNNLGTALAAAGKTEEAVAQYREALRFKPDFAQAHANIASQLMVLGRWEEAMEHIAEVLKLDPRAPGAHYNLGVSLSKEGRTAEAAAEFALETEIDPGNADAFFNLGVAQALLGGKAEAVRAYRECLRLRPADAEARFNLGLLLLEEGNYREAVEHFTRVTKLKARNAQAMYRLGMALEGEGRYGEASERYRAALEASPSLGEARERLERLSPEGKEGRR